MAVRTWSVPLGPGSATSRTVVSLSSRTAWTAASSTSQRAAVLVQPLRGHRYAREASEYGAQGAGGLAFRWQEAAQIAAELLGEAEQRERLWGRGQVDHEQVVRLGERRVAEGAQEGELLGAGERGEFLGVESGGPEEVQDRGEPLLEGGQVLPEAFRRVRPPCGESGGSLHGPGARGHAEHGAEAVRAVGAQHEGAGALAGGGQGGGRGERGAAAAALACDQEGAHKSARYRGLRRGSRVIGWTASSSRARPATLPPPPPSSSALQRPVDDDLLRLALDHAEHGDLDVDGQLVGDLGRARRSPA